MPDKYSAVWVSHSSLSDFQKCPRLYYLNNLYRDSRTGHKISLINPPLALGSAVHEVLESLAILPLEKRFQTPLLERFESAWLKVTGKKGGFSNPETELRYKQRGQAMLARISKHPGPLKRLAVKIKMDLPQYWLSEEDGIILCGKLDWLEYLKEDNAVRIIDFKTGRRREDSNSLQLPIYYLLAHNCQEREVKQVSYWYLTTDNAPTPQPLPDLERSRKTILKLAKEVKLARSLERFKCPGGKGGCKYCQPYEKILRGQAEFVGVGGYDQDLYILPDSSVVSESKII